MINEMRTVTCNARTKYRVGEMNDLLKEMNKYITDMCALQEIRWPGKGTVTKKKELQGHRKRWTGFETAIT